MNKTIDIYTDCAGNRNQMGLSIIIMDGEKERSLIHRTSLGVIKEYYKMILPRGYGGVSVGEAYAILLALREVRRMKVNAVIYTDCDSSFQLLNNVIVRPFYRAEISPEGKYITGTVETRTKPCKNVLLQKIIRKCKRKIRHLRKIGLNVEIRWIPGHVDIYGNERADKAAKQCHSNNDLGRFYI